MPVKAFGGEVLGSLALYGRRHRSSGTVSVVSPFGCVVCAQWTDAMDWRVRCAELLIQLGQGFRGSTVVAGELAGFVAAGVGAL